MTTKIYAYNTGSMSANLLSIAMNAYIIKHRNSKYRPKRGDVIVNWGSTVVPEYDVPIINTNGAVATVSDKLLYACCILSDDIDFSSIEFGTAADERARTWYDEGHTVVARTLTKASEGRGIVLCNKAEGTPLVYAQLYSKYQPKNREYRVHVINGQVVRVQQKLKRKDHPNQHVSSFMVRNTANGFIFCSRSLDEVPESVKDNAIKACRHFNLDFGGVDVLYKEAKRLVDARAYVVEINTAPGIEGETVDVYASKLTELVNQRRGM